MNNTIFDNKDCVIALDIYNNDHGTKHAINAAIKVANKYKDLKIILCGETNDLKKNYIFPENIKFHIGANNVSHNDSPLDFRRKLNSSLIVGIKLLENNLADAFLSSGNSGMYLAAASFLLNFDNKNIRPVFCAILPKGNNSYSLLADCGANLRLRESNYVHMAILAKHYYEDQFKIKNPTIGIINVGKESKKGLPEVQATYNILNSDSRFNFIGNVEPMEAICSNINILLCDGLVGNIFLKTAEAVYSFFKSKISHEFKKSLWNKAVGVGAKKILISSLQQYDYKQNPGAIILGVRKPCFKLHGSSDENVYYHSIIFAYNYIKNTNLQLNSNNSNENLKFDKKSSNNINTILENQALRVHKLLKDLKIEPNNIYIYVKSLTHVSWSKEQKNCPKSFNYERLEHTGDKAINYYVTRYLDNAYPDLDQGQITKLNARIISNKNLSKVALHMELNKYILIGKSVGNYNKLSDKIWASFFEGFIGAINIDQKSIDKSTKIINSIIEKIIMPLARKNNIFITNTDYKTQLQEYIKKIDKSSLIEYKTIKKVETPKGSLFTEALIVNKKIIKTASGYKKQDIHQKIAKDHLEKLNILYGQNDNAINK